MRNFLCISVFAQILGQEGHWILDKSMHTANCFAEVTGGIQSYLWDSLHYALVNPSTGPEGLLRFARTIFLPLGNLDPVIVLECPIGAASLLFLLGRYATDDRVAMGFFHLSKMLLLHKYSEVGDEGLNSTRWGAITRELMIQIALLHRASSLTVPKNSRSDSTVHVVSYCKYPPHSRLPNWSRGNKSRFCQHHNYMFSQFDEPLEPSHHAWTNKVLVIREALKSKQPHYEWIMWMDCDAFFMNQERSLDFIISVVPETTHLIASEDANMFNSAIMLLRNNDWSLSLIERTLELLYVYPPFSLRDNIYHEQSVLMYLTMVPSLLGAEPTAYVSEVTLVPQQWINAYPPEIAFKSSYMRHAAFTPGDLVVSFNGCGSLLNSTFCDNLMFQFYNSSLA